MALTETITGWFERNRARRGDRTTRTVLADNYRELCPPRKPAQAARGKGALPLRG